MALKFSITPNSYAGITAGLSSMVSDLQTFADKEVQTGNEKAAKAAMLSGEATTHVDEASKARNTAQKIQALLS